MTSLGYYLCASFGAIVGFVLASLMQSARNDTTEADDEH
jgi:hypothetical protein